MGGGNNFFCRTWGCIFPNSNTSSKEEMLSTKVQQTEVFRERQGRRGREMAEAVIGVMIESSIV